MRTLTLGLMELGKIYSHDNALEFVGLRGVRIILVFCGLCSVDNELLGDGKWLNDDV